MQTYLCKASVELETTHNHLKLTAFHMRFQELPRINADIDNFFVSAEARKCTGTQILTQIGYSFPKLGFIFISSCSFHI